MADQAGVVLVTGSSSGIGQACVHHFLKTGYAVCGVDVARSKASPPADSKRYLEYAADISDAGQCQAAVEATVAAFGRLDGLAHLAAIHSMKPWNELDAPDF